MLLSDGSVSFEPLTSVVAPSHQPQEPGNRWPSSISHPHRKPGPPGTLILALVLVLKHTSLEGTWELNHFCDSDWIF